VLRIESHLLGDLGDHTGADRLAALSEGEAQALRHGHGVEQLDVQSGVITGDNLIISFHFISVSQSRKKPTGRRLITIIQYIILVLFQIRSYQRKLYDKGGL
jgi:hypothetical protein